MLLPCTSICDTERLPQLAELGIERFVIVGPGFQPHADKNGPGLFVSEVIPALRAAIGPEPRRLAP